jgi:hypothetical protein
MKSLLLVLLMGGVCLGQSPYSTRIGNTTYFSDGSKQEQLGNTHRYYSRKGRLTTGTQIGSTQYLSNGRSATRVGRQMYFNGTGGLGSTGPIGGSQYYFNSTGDILGSSSQIGGSTYYSNQGVMRIIPR